MTPKTVIAVVTRRGHDGRRNEKLGMFMAWARLGRASGRRDFGLVLSTAALAFAGHRCRSSRRRDFTSTRTPGINANFFWPSTINGFAVVEAL